MDWLAWFWIFLKSVLTSTGGFGPLPSLRADLIARGWADDTQIAEALAVGQVSPGPNGLWVVVLGFMIGGAAGAALSLIAVTLPPLLVLVAQRGFERFGPHPLTRGFLSGLALAIAGVGLVVLARIVFREGAAVEAVGFTALGAALAWRRVPILAIVAIAAAAGVAIALALG